MYRKLLVCDDSFFGEQIRREVSNYKFTITLCRNTIDATEAELDKDNYDALLMFIEDDSEEHYAFIRRTIEKHPGIRVFAALYLDRDNIKRNLIEAGVKRYMVMPIVPLDVCVLLVKEFTPFDDGELTIGAIERFLLTKKFARHMPGFLFLCIAVESCLKDPSVLTDLDGALYPYISEIALTTPGYVKSAIKKTGDSARARGFTYYNYNGETSLSNRELLAICADEFAERHLRTLYKSNRNL